MSELSVEAPALAKNVLYGPNANRFVMDALFHLGRWDDMERAPATKARDPDLSAKKEILAGRASASSQIDGEPLFGSERYER